jgi:UDP-N-acetylglucosamine pyrophosphorylase
MKDINPNLFKEKKIDRELSYKILDQVNEQEANHSIGGTTDSFVFPVIDGVQVVDGSDAIAVSVSTDEAKLRLQKFDPDLELGDFVDTSAETITIGRDELEEIGIRLLPYIAYGVLNGGSATSYVDTKKNSSFYPPLFEIISDEFDQLASLSENRPKGLSPAYINPDGTPGCSYMELKMRALLSLELLYHEKTGKTCQIPMFQMTSDGTESQLLEAYDQYRNSAYLTDLIERTGHDITRVTSKKQPLIAAMTPASHGLPRDLFTQAHGKQENLLPLPGGHGQNFLVLKDIYTQLYRDGKRLAYLVNVDNIGNTPSPVYIAITALTGCDGSFEFSYKSPIDIKGGVLLKQDKSRQLTCRDIGVGISREDVASAEQEGKPILFNCATGLFNLEYLDRHLERIIKELPLRVSEQNKDAGRYAQAEQVTWEIIDLMEHPTIIAVEKQERFLAAKLLSESIMTTRASEFAPKLLEKRSEYQQFCDVSIKLETGFNRLMRDVYRMELNHDRWETKRE